MLGLLALALLVPLGGLVRTRTGLVQALREQGAAVGLVTDVGLVGLLLVGPIAALLVAAFVIGRRYGRCTVHREWLVFEPALLPAWFARTVLSRAEVQARDVRPHGVLVRGRDVAPLLFPLLIPTSGPAELEAALLEVDGRDVDPPRSFGRRISHARAALLLAPGAAWMIGALAVAVHVVASRFDAAWAWNVLGLYCLLLLPSLVCVGVVGFPYGRRVHVGRDEVAVGEEVFALDAVTAVGAGQGWLVVSEGARECVAHVGPDEPAAADALRERLRERGREELLGPLPRGAGRARRVARQALYLSPLLLLSCGALAFAFLAPNYQQLRLDDHDHTLHVVWARDGDAPAAIVLLDLPAGRVRTSSVRTAGLWPQTLGADDPPPDDLRVDLGAFPAGTDFVHVMRDGRARASRAGWRSSVDFEALRANPATPLLKHVILLVSLQKRRAGLRQEGDPSIPALLEALTAGTDDPAVRDAALGVTTRRCFHVVCPAGGERLVWGMDRGRVAFVVRAPALERWRVTRGRLGWESGGVGTSHERHLEPWDPPTWRVVPSDGLVFDPRLPGTLDALLEVRRRVAGGETLARALGAP